VEPQNPSDRIRKIALCFRVNSDYKPEEVFEIDCDFCDSTMIFSKKKMEKYLVAFVNCPKCGHKHQLNRKTAQA